MVKMPNCLSQTGGDIIYRDWPGAHLQDGPGARDGTNTNLELLTAPTGESVQPLTRRRYTALKLPRKIRNEHRLRFLLKKRRKPWNHRKPPPGQRIESISRKIPPCNRLGQRHLLIVNINQ